MEKKKSNSVFTLIFLILGVLIYYFIVNYPYHKSGITVKYETEISGILTFATQNRGEISLRVLQSKEKKYFISSSRNYDYEPYDLENFVQGGDSIYKPSSSDTLYIYRGDKKYFFIINKDINYRK